MYFCIASVYKISIFSTALFKILYQLFQLCELILQLFFLCIISNAFQNILNM